MKWLLWVAVAVCLLPGCRKAEVVRPEFPNADFLRDASDFPAQWLTPPYSVTGHMPAGGTVSAIGRHTTLLVKRYDPGLLESVVTRLVVVEDLEFNGTEVVVASAGTTIYLNSQPFSKMAHESVYESAIHEEIVRKLLAKFPNAVDKAAWLACNPKGFRYSEETPGLWLSTDGVIVDNPLMKDGFLSARSMRTFEEDVIVMAGALLGSSWHLTQSRPLNRKAHLLVAFLQRVDPGIDDRLPGGQALSRTIRRDGPFPSSTNGD